MPLYQSIPRCLISLAAVMYGSVLLGRYLNRLGRRMQIPEAFLGLLTAMGADSPEITSAIVSMMSGQVETGVGVVFGSNLFNLASLFGISAFVGGGMSVRRSAAILNGVIGVAITLIAIALLFGVINGAVALGSMLAILGPYAVALALRRETLQRLPLPGRFRSFIADAASDSAEKAKELDEGKSDASPESSPGSECSTASLGAVVLGALVTIIIGSTVLVPAARSITQGWLPHQLFGVVVLAILTGIPNVFTAFRLSLRHKGAAVLTETMNSNSLNIVIGLAVPALIFGGIKASGFAGVLAAGWLLVMTVLVVLLLIVSRGLNRLQGSLLVGGYLVFVGVLIALV